MSKADVKYFVSTFATPNAIGCALKSVHCGVTFAPNPFFILAFLTPRVFEYLATMSAEQAQLPLRRGGLGLPAAVDVSPAAFVGGMASTARFLARGLGDNLRVSGAQFAQELATSLAPVSVATRAAWATCEAYLAQGVEGTGDTVSTLVDCTTVADMHDAHAKTQTRLSKGMADARFRIMLTSVQSLEEGEYSISANAELARLRSSAARGASAFLRGLPGHHRTRIPSVDFRIMLQFWLGCIIPTLVLAPAPCPCYHHRRASYTGQGLADVRGRHDTVCYNGSGAKLKRHNAVLRALQDALKQIHIESTFDQVLSLARRTLPDGSPDPNDQSQKQPDLAVFDTHHGGPLPTLVDGTFPDPTAPSYNSTSSARVGVIANRAEALKAAKYRDDAAASGYSFGPFAIEIFGCWGSSATALLSRWTQHAEVEGTVDTRHITGWSAPHWQELARQWVSVAMQRGNASLIRQAAQRRRHPIVARRTDGEFYDGDDGREPIITDPPRHPERRPPLRPQRIAHAEHTRRRQEWVSGIRETTPDAERQRANAERDAEQRRAAHSETAPHRGSTRSRQRDQQRSQPSPRRVWPPSRRIGRAPYESVGPLPGRNVR